MTKSVPVLLVCALVAAACSSEEPAGGPCQSDKDCKGERVCNAGACVDVSGSGSTGASSSGMSSSSGAGSGGAGGAGSGGAGGGAVEDAGADGSSEDASSGPDATWHDFSAMSGTWQARKPLQSTASCETQPPIGEYVRINIAAMHGGTAVGEYKYCNPEEGNFSTQRCFEAGRLVGATGMDIASEGDTFELLTHDEATGLSSGVLTTARHGTYTFLATHCK